MSDTNQLKNTQKQSKVFLSQAQQAYCSKEVESDQVNVHENLQSSVLKHIQQTYRKPYQTHNIEAFEFFQTQLCKKSYDKLLLDSCCGTAMSSITLALENPDSLVIAIDQSLKRLSKKDSQMPNNCVLIRANCEDFWRMCVEQSIVFDQHTILYPNPWPKSAHLSRRWHAHPVFPYLKPLAKKIILRSNWRIYLEEFQIAWQLLSQFSGEVRRLHIEKPLTLFEKKYWLSSQPLYELVL